MLLTRPKTTPPQRAGGPLSSRGGILLVAAILSLLAAGALLVFLREYRQDLTASDGVKVLVAKTLVPQGTPGQVVAESRLYKVARVKKSELSEGAIVDPADLKGQVASEDLFPGHQLSTGDFESADGSVGSRLTGFERAMAVPVDSAHGMIGKIEAGDRVDVITTQDAGAGSLTAASVAARNSLVLAVPDGDGTGAARRDEQVTIRVPDDAAAAIAAAADGGEVWLVLRPPVGARSHKTDAVLNGLASGRPIDAEVEIDARVRSR